MLWIDVKFANLLSVQLNLYSVKQNRPFLANFRCPICGDSKRHKTKTRGYLYTKGNGLFYKCHNCGIGTTLGNLIKQINQGLYNQYKLERYKEGLDMGNAAKPHSKPEFSFEAPKFGVDGELERLLSDLSELPEHNPAVRYAVERKIPRSRFSDLYYIDDVEKIKHLTDEYDDKINNIEPRLVIPFRNKRGALVGITCRSLTNEKLRYITIHIDKTQPLIYNLNNVNVAETVYCFEGPIDSLFVQNSIAVGNADLTKIEKTIVKDNAVLIFDNQPRNMQLVKIMKQAQKDGWKMVVWPSTIVEKDVNEMVLNGITNIQSIINENTHQGLGLRMKLNLWSKC